MKKLIVLLLALVCVLALTGCQERASTYSFRGEHEYFTISNGSITLEDKEIVFDGGNVEITQSGFFDEVASYTTTFYMLTNGEQKVILSNNKIHQTGEAMSIDSDLGSISGKCVLGNGVKSVDDLKDNLWFELKTTNLNGVENIYQIKLVVSKLRFDEENV